MSLDIADVIGWSHEGTAETDPINAVDALYWKFGVRTINFKDLHPTEIQTWQPIYKTAQRNPSDAQLVETYGQGGLAYYPTSGVPLYLVMGDSASAAGVHTLDNINTGALPWITVRSESTGGTHNKFISNVGTKVQSVSGLINLNSDFKFLSETVTYQSIKTLTTTTGTAAPKTECSLDEAHNSPQFPTDDYTMTGTEKSDRYKYDANMSFLWDTQEFITELAYFNYMIINNHLLGFVENQAELEYIDEGNYQFLWSFWVFRGDAAETWEDYLSEAEKTMVFKIYNNATDYRQFTWTKCHITPSMTGTMTHKDDPRFWKVQGWAEDLQIAVKDGVSDSFYDD